MALRVRVGKGGRVTIPKDIRDLLGIKEGDELILSVREGKIVLERDVIKALEVHHTRISTYAKSAKLGDLINSSLEEEFEDYT